MKRSLFNFGWFVFLVCLTVALPVYVLMSGSATLLPMVLFGAAVSAMGGIVGFLGVAALVFAAEKMQSVGAHEQLSSLYLTLSKLPAWRVVFLVLRYLAQFVLLLALAEPIWAGIVLTGLVGALLGQGLINAYTNRVTPFKVKGNRTFINSAFVKSGSALGLKVRRDSGFGCS